MTRIVLIGAPGSGKSTVGMALAAHLQWPFIDTDSLIELKESKKITDLFVENGEEYFRKVEFETLKEVLQETSAVISLGGGAPISQPAQDALVSSNSTIVFLDVALATAAPRVGFNRDRPLLLGNPRAQWQALSDQRRPIYEKLATQSIKVDDMTVDEIIAIIESNLQ
jgi:shikimate kinase